MEATASSWEQELAAGLAREVTEKGGHFVECMRKQDPDRTFAHAYGPMDLLATLYLGNFSTVLTGGPAATAAGPEGAVAARMVACWYGLTKQAYECNMRHTAPLGQETAKLCAYWGCPPAAHNAMWHHMAQPIFYSPSGQEERVGRPTTEARVVTLFDVPQTMSVLVLTARTDSLSRVNALMHSRTDGPGAAPTINWGNANKDQHIFVWPCVLLPPGLTSEALARAWGAAAQTMQQVQVSEPLPPAFCHSDLLEADLEVDRQALTLSALGQPIHTLSSERPCYLMRSPSSLRHPHQVKAWMGEGAQVDLDPKLKPAKTSSFNASVKELKQRQPQTALDWQVGKAQVSAAGVLRSSQFAHWLLSRNRGHCALPEDRYCRVPSAHMHDPPICAPGGALVMLCAAEWDIAAAQHMLAPPTEGRGPSMPLRQLTAAHVQTFVLLQNTAQLPAQHTILAHLKLPREAELELSRHRGNPHGYSPTNWSVYKNLTATPLARFVRSCDTGLLRPAEDAGLMAFLRAALSVCQLTSHHRRKRQRPAEELLPGDAAACLNRVSFQPPEPPSASAFLSKIVCVRRPS